MRRWNGWGDESTAVPLSAEGAQFLAATVGPGRARPDVALADAVAAVPRSRLPAHPAVTVAPEARLRHARGQSLPDWVALRSGRLATFPDGVAWPATEDEVRALLAWARRVGARVIPYGGGTSVVGHVNPPAGDVPVLTLDLGRLDRLVAFDPQSRLATLEAGASGPTVEAQLRTIGMTLGHFPQSFELSTLGGWIATRSSGQQSLGYGRIEALFAGGRVETPRETWDLPPLPASAAGPDLRQLVLGSEGRLGVITRATVRVRPRPAVERFHGAVLPSWPAGVAAVRALAQDDPGLSMLRLSDPVETEANFALAGAGAAIDRGLRALGLGDGRCLMLVGASGTRAATRRALRVALATAMRHGGVPLGPGPGEAWRRNRFRAPYLRNTVWPLGYAIDTLETAVPWSRVERTAAAVTGAIRAAFAARGERALVYAHLSHVYPDGASIYVTIIFRRGADPDETLETWAAMKHAASEALVAGGGTISHQHGVGVDHAPYLRTEKGAAGMRLLDAAVRSLDPDGLLNPGKLLG